MNENNIWNDDDAAAWEAGFMRTTFKERAANRPLRASETPRNGDNSTTADEVRVRELRSGAPSFSSTLRRDIKSRRSRRSLLRRIRATTTERSWKERGEGGRGIRGAVHNIGTGERIEAAGSSRDNADFTDPPPPPLARARDPIISGIHIMPRAALSRCWGTASFRPLPLLVVTICASADDASKTIKGISPWTIYARETSSHRSFRISEAMRSDLER